MLQLAKDLEIFHLTRHAKERKDRSSTSFSPPFELFLRQHRSSAVPRRLSLFLSLWHCYDIKHGGCTTAQQTCQLGSSMLFFCLTLLATVVDERRTVDLFSHFCHIVDDGHRRSTCTSGLFGLCLCIGGFCSRFLVCHAHRRHRLRAGKIFAQASSSGLRAAIAHLRIRLLPSSVCGGAELLCHRRGALALDLFSLVELSLTDGDRHVWSIVNANAVATLASRQNVPSLYLRCAVSSWSIFVLLLKRHTGSDTEHHGARAERRNSSITSRSTAVRHFFYVSRATSDPARQWCTVPRSSTWFRPTNKAFPYPRRLRAHPRRLRAILCDAAATCSMVIFVVVAEKKRSRNLSVSWLTLYGLVDRLPVSAGNFRRALQRHFLVDFQTEDIAGKIFSCSKRTFFALVNRARNGWTAFARSLPTHRFHDWSKTEAALQRQRHCSVICHSIFKTKRSLERSIPALNEHVLLLWMRNGWTAPARSLQTHRFRDWSKTEGR